MDAIALSMFTEPAAMPVPSSGSTLPEASLFGALVAAAASGHEQKAEGTTEAPPEAAPSHHSAAPDVMAVLAQQWLAQADSPPPFRGNGLEIQQLNEHESKAARASDADEPAPEHHADALIPQLEGSTISSENQTTNAGKHVLATDGANVGGQTSDPSALRAHLPSENPHPLHVVARTEELSLSAPELAQYAAGVGWGVPKAGTDSSPKATVVPATPGGPSGKVASDHPAPLSIVRANVTFTPLSADSPANNPSESTPASTGIIPENAKALGLDKPKTTHDRPTSNEPPSTSLGSTRAPESLPLPASNALASPTTPTDNFSVPPPTGNISPAAENNAEMPMKLAVATREGQTAETQALALHIAARWAKGDSRFTIRLDPPELGRIEVNLSVSSHGHAQAVLAVEKPQTLDLLLRDAPTLERALKDAGLELGSDLSFSLKEEGRPNFARDDQYSPPTRTLELVSAEAADSHPALNAGLVEQLYGLRTARLDITV